MDIYDNMEKNGVFINGVFMPFSVKEGGSPAMIMFRFEDASVGMGYRDMYMTTASYSRMMRSYVAHVNKHGLVYGVDDTGTYGRKIIDWREAMIACRKEDTDENWQRLYDLMRRMEPEMEHPVYTAGIDPHDHSKHNNE